MQQRQPQLSHNNHSCPHNNHSCQHYNHSCQNHNHSCQHYNHSNQHYNHSCQHYNHSCPNHNHSCQHYNHSCPHSSHNCQHYIHICQNHNHSCQQYHHSCQHYNHSCPQNSHSCNTATTAAPTKTTAAPTTTPSLAFVLNLVFRSDEVFSPDLTNTSSPLFQSLATKTIKALEPLFKAQFPNFIRLIVVGFRNGSIITDTQLEFAAANTTANATTPFAEAVATTLKAAITNGSLSINISANFKITGQFLHTSTLYI
ncbi:LIM domain-containing protein A-like isoform X2 [Oncorhynchus keta]|uniref:LIM domain-containing protein A-like isoform X1 n=1 Tax=Oncorhynchus keta TaxID=8018 RepID=UPI00227D2855|nr:LIM domain-containing protein A-like isoform X1 [Oncorhynchus keta]XP_052320378.1 LIM domain-containing protein A-like isoform X2 [Oncorhynchus keta]